MYSIFYLLFTISTLEVLIVTVSVLISVAYVTIAERKTMASMQRRIGPVITGYYGMLQPFADALKLFSVLRFKFRSKNNEKYNKK